MRKWERWEFEYNCTNIYEDILFNPCKENIFHIYGHKHMHEQHVSISKLRIYIFLLFSNILFFVSLWHKQKLYIKSSLK